MEPGRPARGLRTPGGFPHQVRRAALQREGPQSLDQRPSIAAKGHDRHTDHAQRLRRPRVRVRQAKRVRIAYLIAFNDPPLILTGTAFIIIACYVFRYGPTGIRATNGRPSRRERSL